VRRATLIAIVSSALALTAIADVAVPGFASGSVRRPGVPAAISRNLAAFGGSITGPRGPYPVRPTAITFSTYPVGLGLAVYVDHLSWVDWGQPVANARGIVHTRDWPQHGYVGTPRGVIVDQLLSCEGRPYYTYAEMFAPAGFSSNSQDPSVGYAGAR
jgi:hypothetical protein